MNRWLGIGLVLLWVGTLLVMIFRGGGHFTRKVRRSARYGTDLRDEFPTEFGTKFRSSQGNLEPATRQKAEGLSATFRHALVGEERNLVVEIPFTEKGKLVLAETAETPANTAERESLLLVPTAFDADLLPELRRGELPVGSAVDPVAYLEKRLGKKPELGTDARELLVVVLRLRPGKVVGDRRKGADWALFTRGTDDTWRVSQTASRLYERNDWYSSLKVEGRSLWTWSAALVVAVVEDVFTAPLQAIGVILYLIVASMMGVCR